MITDSIKLEIDLPESVILKLEHVITTTVNKALESKFREIQQGPVLLSRNEAAKVLRVSLVTLDGLRKGGLIAASQSGRRVLYDQKEIDKYLKSVMG